MARAILDTIYMRSTAVNLETSIQRVYQAWKILQGHTTIGGHQAPHHLPAHITIMPTESIPAEHGTIILHLTPPESPQVNENL